MRNIKLTIEYDGKNFPGWQSQPGKVSIQTEIERAIEEVTGEKVELIASGRTDAGVHALGQVANFHTNTNIEINKIPYAINSKLSKSIVVKKAEEVEERFHARYNCKLKTYRYIINHAPFPSALNRYREYHMPYELDFEAMQRAAQYFEGEHDFKAFKASGGNAKKTTVRTLTKCSVEKDGDRIIIELTGNGFLYNMVRIISGTILDVGLGKIEADKIPEIIESGVREKAGKTLPPHGLYLVSVDYQNEK
ncbi:MAG: tRNA pseudouridine(38-40) synthase TruA [Clostridia bacterium]|nr:tRNA pseudouridine(38-40) synthase TruA [Clostridia bacterium]